MDKPVPQVLLTLTFPSRSRMDFYALNAGQHFPRFGGSSAGLTVRKTASLITSMYDGGGRTDTERNLDDKFAWSLIQRFVNHRNELLTQLKLICDDAEVLDPDGRTRPIDALRLAAARDAINVAEGRDTRPTVGTLGEIAGEPLADRPGFSESGT